MTTPDPRPFTSYRIYRMSNQRWAVLYWGDGKYWILPAQRTLPEAKALVAGHCLALGRSGYIIRTRTPKGMIRSVRPEFLVFEVRVALKGENAVLWTGSWRPPQSDDYAKATWVNAELTYRIGEEKETK